MIDVITILLHRVLGACLVSNIQALACCVTVEEHTPSYIVKNQPQSGLRRETLMYLQQANASVMVLRVHAWTRAD